MKQRKAQLFFVLLHLSPKDSNMPLNCCTVHKKIMWQQELPKKEDLVVMSNGYYKKVPNGKHGSAPGHEDC
jgi:hypothetical protein